MLCMNFSNSLLLLCNQGHLFKDNALRLTLIVPPPPPRYSRMTNDVGPTLCKCFTNVLCLLVLTCWWFTQASFTGTRVMFKFNNGCSSPRTWFVVRSMLSPVGQTLNQCWFNGGPPSATLIQHQTNLVSTSLIDLLLGHQPAKLSEVGRVPTTMCRSHSESCCRERRNLPIDCWRSWRDQCDH